MQTPYGVGFVVDVPLVSQADTKIFKTTPTIAAGDFKWLSDALIATTLTSKSRSFTSGGTYVTKPGDVITGATSAATATIIGVRLTSGTFAGGDAAGSLIVEGDSGTFQSENLNVGANSNVATIGGALSSAGVFAETALGIVSIGVPSTMTSCRQGTLVLHDAAGAEWCDSALTYETTDHHNAQFPNGVIRQVVPDATPGGTAFDVTDTLLPATALGAKFKSAVALVVASDVADDVNCCALVTNYAKASNTGTFTYAGGWNRTPTGTAASLKINFYAAGIGKAEALNSVVVLADAQFTPAATPSALPVLGSAGPLELINYIALRLGLGKRTFNKTTGVETQRNVADSVSLGTATHTDDGTTVTRVKLT